MLRFLIIIIYLSIFSVGHAFCFDLDMTVDDDIRKNYNSSRLVNDTNTADLDELPDLPEKLKNGSVETKSKTQTQSSVSYPSLPQKQVQYGNIKIPKGTSVNVVSLSKISDWQTKGANVKFKTNTPIYKKKYTIPAGTVFVGEVIESHQPQISCNGGLVVIRIRSMQYKGEVVPVNAYITKADEKFIFLNNIKGERTYLKTMWQKGNWGRSLFNRMLNLTVKLGGDGSTLVLSPFPIAYGTICLGANTLISPITAFFSKGKHVSINSGSHFRIKFMEDAYVD